MPFLFFHITQMVVCQINQKPLVTFLGLPPTLHHSRTKKYAHLDFVDSEPNHRDLLKAICHALHVPVDHFWSSTYIHLKEFDTNSKYFSKQK